MTALEFWLVILTSPVTEYGCESWTVKRADRRNIDSFEIWCWRRALWLSWTTRKTNKWVLEQINPETFWRQNGKTEAVLLAPHHEMARFSGKDNNAWKNRRQQEKRKTKYEVDWLRKRSHRHESIGVEDSTLWTSVIHKVTRSQLTHGTEHASSLPTGLDHSSESQEELTSGPGFTLFQPHCLVKNNHQFSEAQFSHQ